MRRIGLAEFGYELFSVLLLAVALLMENYLTGCVVVLMYLASELFEALAWRRLMRVTKSKLEQRGERAIGTFLDKVPTTNSCPTSNLELPASMELNDLATEEIDIAQRV